MTVNGTGDLQSIVPRLEVEMGSSNRGRLFLIEVSPTVRDVIRADNAATASSAKCKRMRKTLDEVPFRFVSWSMRHLAQTLRRQVHGG